LQSKGFITVNPNAGLRPTTRDITSNPRNFRIIELEAAQLPRALEDVEAAVINGNFAIGAGFNPARDALFLEGEDSPYVNYVVVRRGNENNPAIQAFSEVLRSQKVRDYIDRTWNGSVLAAF
jgi:D-methionine transport system substrate-binding protein